MSQWHYNCKSEFLDINSSQLHVYTIHRILGIPSSMALINALTASSNTGACNFNCWKKRRSGLLAPRSNLGLFTISRSRRCQLVASVKNEVPVPAAVSEAEGQTDLVSYTWLNKPSDRDLTVKMKSSSRLFTIGLVASWYSSNIGVLLLNKYLLSNYGFKYPIFLTMCHMTACSLLSYIAIAWMKMVPMQTIRSRVQFLKISALSFVFCISVVFGNISLRYLPVSFNQAIGATTPFFTAVFAYLMTLKREAWLTYVTLIPVVTGVIIASGGEPSFHLFGFIICIAATAARALKSVLQGILLSSEGEKLNSMNLLLYMAPIAVVFLLPATLIMEENVVGITLALARDDVKIIWYLLFNSALAYFVNLTNFLVTKHTSALTLQVLGNAKGAVAVVVSILIFRNPVSVTGMMGYSLTVIGVVLYSEAKKRSK
ncbi:putative sugar phosphate/phosphate translocator [Morus notabilis]|uniref:Putative sugar phosphate/phosphate translocator n=2 Tax=Morus notabilis TaxID=981085 RepID=W9R479_9ROSA|nr:putative sugar phosphate/phosphate translocator [Morus notabilis]